MKTPKAVFALITLSVCAAQIVIAAELEPATLVAWNTHLDNADVQLRDRVTGIHPFLWVDESQERVDRVRRGDVVVGPMEDKAYRAFLTAWFTTGLAPFSFPALILMNSWQ